MKKTAITLISLLQFAIAMNAAPPDTSPGVASRDFVDAFSRRSDFIEQRMHEIDSFTALPKNAINEYRLGCLWRNIQVDSALAHMRIANDLALLDNNFSLHVIAGSAICALLPHIDAAGEALYQFQNLDTVGASHEARLSYHMAGQEIWFTLANSVVLDTIRHIYNHNGAEHSRAICNMTHPNDVRHNLAAAHNAFVLGHNAVLVANLNEVLNNPDATHHQKARANWLLARHYFREEIADSTMGKYYALRSAAEFIRDADLHTSKPALAALLLIDDPSTPIGPEALHTELGNALKSGSTIAAGESAPYLHMLTDMNAATIHRQRMALVALCILCLLLASWLAMTAIHNKRNKAAMIHAYNFANEIQKQSFINKQEYLAKFIKLSDSHMTSTEDFLRSGRRKLSAGQINDLKIQLKGNQLIAEQLSQFCATFDSAFLSTFPNFVNEVNRLLLPDKKLETPAPNTLTTELRIAAFARLGMEDSAKMARFLGLSLTTVYTYRNKLRAKAVNRSSFYSDLQHLPDNNVSTTTTHLQP